MSPGSCASADAPQRQRGSAAAPRTFSDTRGRGAGRGAPLRRRSSPTRSQSLAWTMRTRRISPGVRLALATGTRCRRSPAPARRGGPSSRARAPRSAPRRAPRARARRGRGSSRARCGAAAPSACARGWPTTSAGTLPSSAVRRARLLVGVAEDDRVLEARPRRRTRTARRTRPAVSPGWPTMKAVRNVRPGTFARRRSTTRRCRSLPCPRRMRLSIASAACCSGMSTYGTTRGWLARSSTSASSIVSG